MKYFPLCFLLGLLFIGLKLGHVIAWSWWLVLLPIYGGAAFVFVMATLIAFIAACAVVIKS